MYELWPLEGPNTRATTPSYTLFYDPATTRWQQGDWYGLRFLARRTAGERCPVHYDSHSQKLAIPQVWRWPELYERALVLASGHLPSWSKEWLVYEAIGAPLLTVLSGKLGLHLVEVVDA